MDFMQSSKWLAHFGAVLVLVSRSAIAVAAPRPEEPKTSISLSDAITLALDRSPALASATAQVAASAGRLRQSGARPNPRFELELEDFSLQKNYRGAQQAQTTIRVGQLFEFGGKRDARRAVAESARTVAERSVESTRADVIATVATRFASVLAAQQHLALATKHQARCEAALAAIRNRREAGKDSALDEIKADIALARARIGSEHATHQLTVARNSLSALWASAAATFERADGDIFERAPLPPFAELASRIDTSPEITMYASERTLRTAEIALANAQSTPDVTAAIGVRRLEGPGVQTVVGQFSLPLPVADRNQGAIAAARAELQRAEFDEQSARSRLHAMLFELHQEIQHAGVALEELGKVVLPQADRALDLSQQGFRAGRYSLVDLLDAQDTVAEVRREAIDTALNYQHLVFAMERLLGGPIATGDARGESIHDKAK